MKYMSIILLATSLWGTWALFTSPPSAQQQLHQAIQQQIPPILEQWLRERHKDSSEVLVSQVWTEKASSKLIKTHFSFQVFFDNQFPPSQISSSAVALLQAKNNEQNSSADFFDSWEIIKISNEDPVTAKFDQGFTIQSTVE